MCKLALCQRKLQINIFGIGQREIIKNKILSENRKITNKTRTICDVVNRSGQAHKLDRWTRRVAEWTPRNDVTRKDGSNKRWKDISVDRAGPKCMKGQGKIWWEGNGGSQRPRRVGDCYLDKIQFMVNVYNYCRNRVLFYFLPLYLRTQYRFTI